jgi:hypothetical protein
MSQHIKTAKKVNIYPKSNQSALNITDILDSQMLPASQENHPTIIKNMEDALFVSRNHQKSSETTLKPKEIIKSSAISVNVTVSNNKSIDYPKIKVHTQRKKENTEFLKVFKIKQNAVSKILSRTYNNMIKQEQSKPIKICFVRGSERVPIKTRIAFLDYKSINKSARNLNSDIDCVRVYRVKNVLKPKMMSASTERRKKCTLYTHYINPQVVPLKISESRDHILKELSALQRMASSKVRLFKI